MKQTLKILAVILVLTQCCFAQKYDPGLVSKATELNFAQTKMRGIESNQITYFVEKDLQTVAAYESGKLKWKTNVIKICGKPDVGKPEIRHIRLEAEKLRITYGKHSVAEIDKTTGKAKFFGAD